VVESPLVVFQFNLKKSFPLGLGKHLGLSIPPNIFSVPAEYVQGRRYRSR